MLSEDTTAPRKQRHTARRILARPIEERGAEELSYWRSQATRYDELALTYCSATVLHAVVTWSTLLGYTPWRRRSR
ncbi:MAG: hypothetical protein PVSMB10_10490 [Pseudarthrobacter sp.]